MKFSTKMFALTLLLGVPRLRERLGGLASEIMEYSDEIYLF